MVGIHYETRVLYDRSEVLYGPNHAEGLLFACIPLSLCFGKTLGCIGNGLFCFPVFCGLQENRAQSVHTSICANYEWSFIIWPLKQR
jgi:hypothetical protein